MAVVGARAAYPVRKGRERAALERCRDLSVDSKFSAPIVEADLALARTEPVEHHGFQYFSTAWEYFALYKHAGVESGAYWAQAK